MENIIEKFILSGIKNQTASTRSIGRDIFKTEVVSKFLRCKVDYENTFEVPATLFKEVAKNIPEFTEFAFPIMPDAPITRRRLVRGMLKDFIGGENNSYRQFSRVVSKSDNIYYGLPGIILDCNYNILMAMTVEINARRIPNNHIIDVQRLVCRISPLVFEHPDRIIEKTIIKNVLPTCLQIPGSYLSNSILMYTAFRSHPLVSILGTGVALNKGIKVIIDSCEDLIHTVEAPSISVFNEEKVRELIVERLDEIIPDV